jgi:hypothetical protein
MRVESPKKAVHWFTDVCDVSTDLPRVLDLLCDQYWTRPSIHLFRRQLQEQSLKIRVLDGGESQSIEQLLGNNGEGIPGAGFYFSGHVGWLLLPKNLEMGLLAPILLHEIQHATDLEYQQSCLAYSKLEREFSLRVQGSLQRSSGTGSLGVWHSIVDRSELQVVRNLKETLSRMTALRTLRTEQKAYLAQWRWIEQQTQRDVNYRSYLEMTAKRGWQLSERHSLEEIAIAYGVDPKWAIGLEAPKDEDAISPDT